MANNLPYTTWVRPLLAVFCVLTLCATVILKYDVPPWFLVTTSSIISFYFGHVNGTAEKNTTQAGDIAITALRQAVNPSTDQPSNTTRVVTTTTNEPTSNVSNKGIV